MEKSNLSYIKFTALSGIIAYPVFTYKAIKRLIKNERIKDSLEIIIEKTKETAKLPPKEELTPVKIQLLRDSYNKKNDLFSFHFKSETIRNLSFDEKIEYCLEKYKEESRKISTATNFLVLEENFLNGASGTLTLYFFFKNYGIDIESQKQNERAVLMQINQTVVNNEYKTIKNEVTNKYIQNIDKSVTNKNQNFYGEIEKEKVVDINQTAQNSVPERKDFRSLFVKEEHYNIVFDFMRNYDLFPVKGKFKRGNKSKVAYLLLELQKQAVIIPLEDKQMSEIISNSFEDGISRTTFCDVKDGGDINIDSSTKHLLLLLYEELDLKR